MKAISKIMPFKVKESIIFQTVISTKAAFKEACFTVTVNSGLQMAILTKEIMNRVG